MTAQEIFDTVVQHLRTQGKPAIRPDAQPEAMDRCRYRTAEGLKCAFGCLITDEEYSGNMEGIAAYYLISKYPSLARYDEHRLLIEDLQHCHDHIVPLHWEDQFKFIANSYNLEYKAP